MDKKNIETQLASIVQAVAERDAALFDVNLRKLEFEELPRAWHQIASAHTGGNLNLTLVLNQWLGTAPDSALELMEAMKWITQLDGADALRFLLFSARVPDGYHYSAAILLEPALKAMPYLANELVAAITDSDTIDVTAVNAWAIAYTKADPVGSVELALVITGPHCGLVLSLVLQCVELNLPSVIQTVLAQESTIVASLLTIVTVPIQALAPWWVLARMSCFSSIATIAVLDAISAADDTATVGLASSLSTMQAPAFGTPPISIGRVVETLFNEAARSKAVQYAVDHALAMMLRRPSTQQAVLDGLARLGSSEEDIEVCFQRTFQILAKKSALTTSVLTVWLVNPNANGLRIRNLISSVIGQAPTLDACILAAATVEMRRNVARRLLALTHDGDTLCCFVRVFAEEPCLQPGGVVTAGEMLNHALAEYPAATTLFLQNRVRDCGKLEKYSAMYRTLYCNALSWKRVLKSLPKIRELQPSLSQTQALWAMQRRHNRDVMRGAHEKSIFASISKSGHIVQGRRGAIHRVGEPSLMFTLQELSHSIELPTSEVADPVGGSLRRAKYLRDAK